MYMKITRIAVHTCLLICSAAFCKAQTDPIQPVLTNPRVLPSGVFAFTILGEAGSDYTVDFSTNVATWAAATNLFNSSSQLFVEILRPSNSPAGFIRVRRVFYVPTILTQPQSLTVDVGSNASFSVAANGSVPLAYQWRFNNTNIVGQTIATLNLYAVTTNNAGNYSVIVSNPGGVATSQVAVLTVIQPMLAPASINGLQISFDIQTGTLPFALSGYYRVSLAAANNQFVLVPYSSNVKPDLGTFTWTRTSPNSGSLQVMASVAGNVTATLTFLTSNSGTAHLADGTGTQDANFGIESISESQMVPASIQGKTVTVGVTGGSGLASSGVYRFVAAPGGNSYNIESISPNIMASSGTYLYSTINGFTATIGAVNFNPSVTLNSQLTFINTNAGTIVTTIISGGSGSQTGTFLVR